MPSYALSDLAAQLSGVLQGADCTVHAVATAHSAQGGTVVAAPKPTPQLLASGACLVLECAPEGFEGSCVLVPSVAAVWPKLLKLFEQPQATLEGVHPTAYVHSSASVHPTAYVGAFAVIEAHSVVQANAHVAAQAYVGQHCSVGAHSVLEAGVRLIARVQLGSHCLIGANTVLGHVGFGFAAGQRLPHLGGVQLGNHVELGANCSVQRGTVDHTSIGNYCKLGDGCIVAHNVTIGQRVGIVGDAGISGSVTIEDDVRIMASCTFSDHITVGQGATILMGSAVTKSVPKGEVWSGVLPASPRLQHYRALAVLKRKST